MAEIATIDSDHVVGLFIPDRAALFRVAAAGIMSFVNARTAASRCAWSVGWPTTRR